MTNKNSNSTDVERARELLHSASDCSTRKELWQMTKAEYETLHGKPRKNTTGTGGFSPHKSAVEIALNRGLPVPSAVLADYPGLSGR
jgi:hypothetical protein